MKAYCIRVVGGGVCAHLSVRVCARACACVCISVPALRMQFAKPALFAGAAYGGTFPLAF